MVQRVQCLIMPDMLEISLYLCLAGSDESTKSESYRRISSTINTGGLMVFARRTPGRNVRVGAQAVSLRCVFGQDTLLSQCLSPPRSNNLNATR